MATCLPVQRDMTRVAAMVNLLRIQRIEIGQATGEIKVSDGTYPAGSYVIKRDQPYGRLAKNLLERQVFPDPNLRTYDDSGWTMGLAMLVDVKEIKDKAILDVPTTAVTAAAIKGRVSGSGTAGLAIAHFGSNDMIALRYKLRGVPMKIVEKSFTAEGVEFPGRLVRGAAARGSRGGAQRGGRARADRGGAVHGAGRGDARCRRAAPCRLLVMERHPGDWLGTVHARQVRRALRSDLQGARPPGQPAGRLRRDPDADPDRRPARRCSSRPPRGPCPT